MEAELEAKASQEASDARKRQFLKGSVLLAAGFFATTLFPRRADALIMGGTAATNVVGAKNVSNVRINPATEDTLALIRTGLSVLKKTTVLTSSGTVHTPASGKRVRVYSAKFSLDTTMTSVSFRFASGGTDFEKYLAPRTGGLYGTNNHPNYYEGGVDDVVYCSIDGTGSVQINIDYLEV